VPKYPAGQNNRCGLACEAWRTRLKRAGAAEESRGILARVNVDGLRALKILAIERDTTLQGLAVEALNDLLAKYGKRPVVKNPLLLDK
jgi:hypothetical protein